MANLDENRRNADWVKVLASANQFASWSADRIDDECSTAYTEYLDALRRRHRNWPTSPSVARETVFPESLVSLAGVLPLSVWHHSWWAAKSSQTLALTLLGAATLADPSLAWLPNEGLLGQRRLGIFEVELDPRVLNEHPRQTQLDYLALGSLGVIAAEAKFSERGFGVCSCEDRASGVCSPRVYARPYWDVAGRELGLSEVAGVCPLSLAYQPVRNIAAAAAIAGQVRASGFVLFYDARNPYFVGAGAWAGWVTVLEALMRHAQSAYASMSWQRLLGVVPLDDPLRAWALDKHGLDAEE